ncbi:MAG: aconitate hydratase [Candidatus Izemoplasma sp.]
MAENLTYKILKSHLLEGKLTPGSEIKIKIDQTLTQDSTGTMVYLQLDALDVKTRQTELSVAYIDHNTIQSGFESADDHAFIKSAALKYDIIYSKPGNGICHQVHLERFSKPGKTLIGSDSHTPTSGGMGMLAIGAGGLDVAIGIGKGFYYLKVPKVLNIKLINSLNPWVSAKDVILHILGLLTVKGGVGYVVEYSGEGIKSLSLTDRATITNMGAELGATTSIFPADELTKDFLERQGRVEDFTSLSADLNAKYDKSIEIDLSSIKPMVSKPHSPDNVAFVEDEYIAVDQIAIGSCTNSSYTDLMKVAKILKGKQVHPDIDLVISPGSSNILKMMASTGALSDLIEAGARILESSCGPCIGMGQAPKSKAISLRTFNRNFKGRCGTVDAGVYLVSPETAAVSAITGYLTDPRTLGEPIDISLPRRFEFNVNYFIRALEKASYTDLVMGENIKPFPLGEAIEININKTVLLKVGDNLTTDDIMPSNATLLPYRSNIPKLSLHSFGTQCDDFSERANKYGGGIVIGGDNYGQGSSREHAALVPLYLGVKAVIVKSFARIHKANLINSGILPLEFNDLSDYNKIDEFDELELIDVINSLNNKEDILVKNITKNATFKVSFEGSKRDVDTLLLGGTINYLKGVS